MNDQNHLDFILNDFNILNIINQADQHENKDFINLITDFNLNKKLLFIKFMNLDIRIMINFNYIHQFFIDYSIFIIYIKIQFRFIKNIKSVKIQFFICDIINLDYNVNNKRVILMIFNVLYMLDINVNFLLIKKILNVNIEIIFYKKDYILI